MTVYDLAALPRSTASAFLEACSDEELAYLASWQATARPEQRPPPNDATGVSWQFWLILAGRGWGKTRTGAEWVIERAKAGHGPIALIGETAADVRDVMVEAGDSSLLKIAPPEFMPTYEPSKRRLTFPNGVTAHTYSAFSKKDSDQLRGPQHASVWADEVAKWRYMTDAWDNMELGLRVGSDPKCTITTTPRPLPLLRRLIDDPACVVTVGSTYDNRDNLSERFFARILERYEGTRLGRQEIHAELLLDTPGALWRQAWIDGSRVDAAPESLDRVVIGLDPSGGSDAIGIVAVGRHGHHGYVLEDATLETHNPLEWARAAVGLHRKYQASSIIAERNFGGDMVLSTIRQADSLVPVTMVTASRGKAVRAEPCAVLYQAELGIREARVHHVGQLPKLEDEMTSWVPGETTESPNRMDALVWALTDLFLDAPAEATAKHVDWI